MANYLHLTHYGVLKMTGEDAEKYLQGQITNDVTQLTDDNVQLACQCDAKGKVWSVFYLLKQDNNYLLIAPKDSLLKSFAAFKKFAVFSKVEITDATDSFLLYGIQGADNSDFSAVPMSLAKTSEGAVFRLPENSDRYILLSDRAFENADSQEKLISWQTADITEGLPFISDVASNEYIPQMLNVQALNGISFTKGCYLGQETVARTKYLGKNKRAGFILSGQSNTDISVEDAIEKQLGENWRRAGTIANHVWDQQNQRLWIYAVLPNDLETDANLRLKNQPDIRLTIQPLPYLIEE